MNLTISDEALAEVARRGGRAALPHLLIDRETATPRFSYEDHHRAQPSPYEEAECQQDPPRTAICAHGELPPAVGM